MKSWPSTILLALVLVHSAVAQRRSACVECHEEKSPLIYKQHLRSVHVSLGCVACHGGDPMAPTKERGHSTEKGFRGKFTSAESAVMCAACHSDAAQVASYGLDSAVVVRWRSSVHGKQSAKGDPRAAGCGECHGVHDVLSHRDPKSNTHALHVPVLCANCHSDPKRMGDTKLPLDQHNEFLAGAHGLALAAEVPGLPELAPTCADCHGAHGAKPPDALSVPAVCKNCHYEENRYLMKGAHFKALRHTGTPSCVNCHDNHRTALPASIPKTCGECHEEDDQVARRAADRLERLLILARQHLDSMGKVVETVDPELDPSKHRLLLAERKRIEEMYGFARRVSHSLDLDALERAVRRLGDSVRTAAAVSATDLHKSNGFGPLVITLLISAAVLLLVAITIMVAKLMVRMSRAQDSRLEAGGAS